MEGDNLAVEQDFAVIEGVDAADAFHQRRLAGAVVAERSQNLAATGLEAHIPEGVDRAEALLGATDGESRRRRGLAHWIAAA